MAEEQARWCLSTHQSPETWKQLTGLEREAFYDEIERSRTP